MALKVKINLNADKTINTLFSIFSYIRDEYKKESQQRQALVTAPHPDPYEVLGISPSATPEQITQRYRDLAKIFHPDMQGGNIEAMARLNEAYEQICHEKDLTKN